MKTLNRVLAVGLTASAICAGHVACGAEPGSGGELYHANEFSIDIFGTGSINQETIENISGRRVSEDVRLGAGLGANYFFTRHFGVGGDAFSEDLNHSLVDVASLNLIARLPIGDTGFAPYIFGGGVRQFDEIEQWGGDAGGGFEFRFASHWSVFLDARYVIADKTDNYGVGRGGLRFNF